MNNVLKKKKKKGNGHRQHRKNSVQRIGGDVSTGKEPQKRTNLEYPSPEPPGNTAPINTSISACNLHSCENVILTSPYWSLNRLISSYTTILVLQFTF